VVPDIIDSEQCGKLLRCTIDKIEELACAGEIPGIKIGRTWLFVRADLIAYLAEKARTDAQERRAQRQPDAMQSPARPSGRLPPMWSAVPGGRPPTGAKTVEMQKPEESSRRAQTTSERPFVPRPLYVSAAEAARLLSMGRSTFWSKVKNKMLPQSVKIGGLTRWRVSDLERFVDELGS
jgi:excisionase family DNA binding protein